MGTSRPQPAALLELLKPITWFPPMWAFLCGAVSTGAALLDTPWLLVAGILLAGPLVCGASQVVNDWFDREVDAINEPGRPIPSGRVPGSWGLVYAIFWTTLAAIWGAALGFWVGLATLLGLGLAWAYSAPPSRLKRNGWWGAAAVGFSYEGLAWVTGAAVFLGGALPPWPVLVMAGLYSIGAHGIMTLNDFKSVAGDRALGLILACRLRIAQVCSDCLLVHGCAPDYRCGVSGLFYGLLAGRHCGPAHRGSTLCHGAPCSRT